MKVFYVDTTGSVDKATFDRLILKTVELAGAGRAAALAVHTLRNLDETDSIRESFGATFVRQLAKSRSANAFNIRWYLLTDLIKTPAFKGGPALAPYADPALVAKLNRDRRVTSVVYAPWNDNDLPTLRAAHQDAEAL